MNAYETPVLLLTGYLGSGKTTLLNRILTNERGIRFAVIVNDIGEVNIDASLIQKGGIVDQQDDSLIALQNGCICCTLKTDLIEQILGLVEQQKFDYILIAFDKVNLMRIYMPLLKLYGFRLAFIADEYPEPIRKLKKKIPLGMKLFYKLFHRMFRFRVLMTGNLQRYYDNEICRKDTHIMSTIVDTHRFDGLRKEKCERRYMCYMGNFDLRKDNVDNIVEAFAIIADKYPDIDLHLYGTPTAKDKEIIENLIKKNKLEKRIHIKGRIDYDLVPQTLMNATLLVTSQPDTKRAEGGFPTKMGEYMMTANPTLLTDVGEIHQYIKDGENAFMVPPHDPKAYAEKIEYILDNYSMAIKVGEKGREYILDNFSLEKIGFDFKEFLKTKI